MVAANARRQANGGNYSGLAAVLRACRTTFAMLSWPLAGFSF